MWILLFIYFFLVVYLLSPGVILMVSRRFKLKQVAAIHSVIIALILVMTLNPAMKAFSKFRY
jgi:hypothetical protein